MGICLLFLSSLLFFLPDTAHAGPLNSFALSPIPYWDDDSTDVIPTWDSTIQTVTLAWENKSEDSDYWEDCSDVTDWTPDPGNAPTTDGDIISWEVIGNNGWFWIYSNEPSAVPSGSTVKIRMRLNNSGGSTDIQPRLYSGDAHTGSVQVLGTENPTAVWVVYTYTTTIITESFVFLGKHATTDFTLEVDWIRIYDEIGELDLNVPITRQDSQAIELYVNSTELDSEVTLELYNNVTASGTYCSFNSSHVIFPSDGFTGVDYAQTDGWSRIKFDVDNERANGMITAADNESAVINYWQDNYVLSGNNWLKFSDATFEGSFTLMYINGDTNYTTQYDTPIWVKTGTDDGNVLQHQQGINAGIDNTVIDHDTTYTCELPYLQYLRTELFMGIIKDWTGLSHSGISINITFPNNEEIFVNISHHQTSAGYAERYDTDIIIKDSLSAVAYSVSSRHGDLDAVSVLAKFMYWRTQEDNLGIMFWGDYATENLFTGGWVWDAQMNSWLHVQGENETLWISDFVVEDFSLVKIELRYFVQARTGTDDTLIDYQYNYFQYDYYIDSGVVEPHFSDVWWRSHDRYTSTNEYMHAVAEFNLWPRYNEDPNIDPTVPGDEPPMGLLETIALMFQNIAEILGGGITFVANIAWSGFVSAVLAGVALLAGAAEAVINAIAPGAGTEIIGALALIPGLIVGLFSLVIGFFTWIAGTLGIIAGGLAWADTYLFTPQSIQMICLVLIALPLTAFTGVQNYKGTGYEGAMNWLLAYATIGIMILGLFWRLTMGIINTVANFIPLT